MKIGNISLAAALGFSLTGPAMAVPLNTPFALHTAPRPDGVALACETPAPEAPPSLNVSSKYDQTDPSRSKIDDARAKAYEEGMKAVRGFTQDVVGLASNYTQTRGNRLEDGMCALLWIDAWAKADALANYGNRQSALSATRLIAALSIAYVQVRSLAKNSDVNTARIEAWLAGQAEGFRDMFDATPDVGSSRQNHRYGGGWAVAAAGLASNRRDLLTWGIDSYRIGACQITEDGALPRELARQARARDYHLHAVAPLVMIAELAEANELPAYQACGGALHRLVAFTLDSVVDETNIAELSAAEQRDLPTRGEHLRGDIFAWVEPYFQRFPDRARWQELPLSRPLYSTNLGGRTTVLFGVPYKD
ncbi:MAG: alginate lyase family protein [Pseudomonadota bacterium]